MTVANRIFNGRHLYRPWNRFFPVALRITDPVSARIIQREQGQVHGATQDAAPMLATFFPSRGFEHAIEYRFKFRRPVQLDHVPPHRHFLIVVDRANRPCTFCDPAGPRRRKYKRPPWDEAIASPVDPVNPRSLSQYAI